MKACATLAVWLNNYPYACCRLRWYQVKLQHVRTYTHTHTNQSFWWKQGTRITVKAAPEMRPVIQRQIPWSPTCTTKQWKKRPTHTHWLDPTSSVPCSKTTQLVKHLNYSIKRTDQRFSSQMSNCLRLSHSLLNLVLDQIWHRWHSSVARSMEKKKLAAATPLIGYSASGVFLCVEHKKGFSRDQALPESGWFTWSLQQCGNESRWKLWLLHANHRAHWQHSLRMLLSLWTHSTWSQDVVISERNLLLA